MRRGARTPEELETLLEDAFVIRDREAVAELFEDGAVLVADHGGREARGGDEIARWAREMWAHDRTYLADPRRVLQAREDVIRATSEPAPSRTLPPPPAEEPTAEELERLRAVVRNTATSCSSRTARRSPRASRGNDPNRPTPGEGVGRGCRSRQRSPLVSTVKSVDPVGDRRWHVMHKPIPLRPPRELELRQLAGEPPRRLVLRQVHAAAVFKVEYRLEPTQTGTRFTQVSEFTWKTLPQVLHGTLGRAVGREVRGQLRTLKALVERDGRHDG